jgi:N-acetyl-anhydromuramyl-L-alanine amidase AmpD
VPEPIDLRGTLPTREGAAPYYTRPLEGVVGLTIHYSASSPFASPAAIAAYQVGPNAQEAFPAIAYHLIIDHAGAAYLCHDLDVRCWHNGAVVGGVARNRSHVGICWIGNDSPTAEQIRGMGEAIAWCEAQLGRALEVEGHSDSDSTQCPGPTWPSWRDAVMAVVEAYR